MMPDFSTRNGMLLVDKPAGISSAQVVSRIKHHFHFTRIGHGGTLDPMATGLLAVLVGKGTRLQDVLFDGEKEYFGKIQLGLRTDTNDITGTVLSECVVPPLDEGVLSNLRELFSGRTEQIPPDISAVHVLGKRSYQRVRKGEIVNLSPRNVSIRFKEFRIEAANRLFYRVKVSKGTYIRSLARDIGEHLGCGAALDSICRSTIGEFCLDQSQRLDELLSGVLPPRIIPVETLVQRMDHLRIAESTHRDLFAGRSAFLNSLSTGTGRQKIALLREDGCFCGLIECRRLGESDELFWKVGFLLSPEDLRESGKAF